MSNRNRDFRKYMADPDPDLVAWVWEHFDRDALARVCEMGEHEFAKVYGFTQHMVKGVPAPENFFLHRAGKDSSILAVAHLDTVGLAHQRRARFLETEGGPIVFSRALDDRLGAYIILELLPKLGMEFDVLLTVGEESGNSTAQFFDKPGHEYNWMIEFDRGGTDVVLYQYEDHETASLVEECGAVVAEGIFSDISFLEHLGIKGFNWGVGYRDYHGPKAHAWLDDTVKMIAYFLSFHAQNKDLTMPHTESQREWWGGYRGSGHRHSGECWVDDLDCDGDVHDDENYGLVCDVHQKMFEADDAALDAEVSAT